jgi:hypothetical protein
MDLNSAAYCELYQSKPVDENDPCKHLYPPSYADFYAAAPYTGTEDFGMSFGYHAHYDPDENGGYCHGEIYDYISTSYDDDDGDYQGESHSYFLDIDLNETELLECNKVIDEFKVKLADNQNCIVQIGSGYYY